MEGVPKFLDYTDVMQTFLQIPGVVRVHNLRIWALSINKIALAAHLAVGTYKLHDFVQCKSLNIHTQKERLSHITGVYDNLK